MLDENHGRCHYCRLEKGGVGKRREEGEIGREEGGREEEERERKGGRGRGREDGRER